MREQREEEEEEDDRQREFMMPTTQLQMRGSSILEERSFPPYKTETKCDQSLYAPKNPNLISLNYNSKNIRKPVFDALVLL